MSSFIFVQLPDEHFIIFDQFSTLLTDKHFIISSTYVDSLEQTPESEIAGAALNSEELEEESDDQSEFTTGDEGSKKNCIQPRWPTRVFAAECVRRIIATCQSASPAHFDLQLAKELHLSKNKGDFIAWPLEKYYFNVLF